MLYGRSQSYWKWLASCCWRTVTIKQMSLSPAIQDSQCQKGRCQEVDRELPYLLRRGCWTEKQTELYWVAHWGAPPVAIRAVLQASWPRACTSQSQRRRPFLLTSAFTSPTFHGICCQRQKKAFSSFYDTSGTSGDVIQPANFFSPLVELPLVSALLPVPTPATVRMWTPIRKHTVPRSFTSSVGSPPPALAPPGSKISSTPSFETWLPAPHLTLLQLLLLCHPPGLHQHRCSIIQLTCTQLARWRLASDSV